MWTNLHEGWAVEEGKAIEEDNNPDDSRRDEQICVPAQPQVVQGNLLPKVVPDTHTNTQIHERKMQLRVNDMQLIVSIKLDLV